VKKFTKEQIEQLKVFWSSQKETTDRYYAQIEAIEQVMSKLLGIEGVEFFWCDNNIVGIGTTDREYKLVQDEELEGRL